MTEIRHSDDANLLYKFFSINFRLELFDTSNYSIVRQFYGTYTCEISISRECNPGHNILNFFNISGQI